MYNGMNSSGLHVRKISIPAAIFLLLVSASMAVAQLPTATILGVVKDSSGSVVPDAKLTARNVDTGQTRTTTSATDGSYRFSALPVGPYEVRAEISGFETEVRAGLELAVSQEAVVNFSLQIGAVTQTIAVTAEAPLVNTTSGSLGGLVDEQRVADLPLNGRNYVDLGLMQLGVTQDNINRGAQTGGPVMAGTWFSSNGAPPRSNNYMLDGAIMQNYNNASTAGSSGSTLGVEGIREFRLVTNSFSAEYGMRMGSQMTIVSKGGTNQFHGSAYEYIRNSAMDARNFFDRVTATTPRRLPEFQRNQYGASLGGPIKKDRTFFFVVFESLRERLGVTSLVTTMPTGCKGPAGGTVTNTACPLLGSVASVTVAPIVTPFFSLWPTPNLPGNMFTFPYTQPTDEYYGQARIDQTISSNDSMFVRYTGDNDLEVLSGTLTGYGDSRTTRPQFATVSENHIFSSTLLNTARLSFSRTKLDGEAIDPVIGPNFSFAPGLPMGSITAGSGLVVIGIGGTEPSVSTQNIYTISDDLFLTKGRHALKLGTLINHFRQAKVQGNNYRGAAAFNSIVQFLQAQPATLTLVTPGTTIDRDYRFWTEGFYAQDDWKVTARFTLNLGLRYEFATVPTERFNRVSNLVNILTDANFTVGPIWKNNTLHNFSPRFGFGWDVMGDGKTAVRGGFGEPYDIANNNSMRDLGNASSPPFSSQSLVSNPATLTIPFAVTANAGTSSAIRPVDYNLKQTHALQWNLAVERQLPFQMALTVAYAGSRGLNIPILDEGNVTVPTILPNGQPFWSGTNPRMNPNWGSIEYAQNASGSWYNALQVGVQKRLQSGLQFQANYTWAKVEDETDEQIIGDSSIAPPYPQNIKLEKAPAGFDVRQVFHLNTIYHFPQPAGGQFLTSLLRGWWAGSILTLQSGYPLTPRLSANRSRSLADLLETSTDRPNLNPGRNNSNITSGTSTGCLGVPAGTPLGTPNLFIDPCAFSIQPIGFLGNAGRDILTGPGTFGLDFSLAKDTALRRLGEAGKIEFRAEVFNILNHTNFAPPGNTIFAGTQDVQAPLSSAGQITRTATSARQIQFSLRLIF